MIWQPRDTTAGAAEVYNNIAQFDEEKSQHKGLM